MTTYTSKETAFTDYNGRSNSDTLINRWGTSYAAGKCRSYTFPNGQTGYLPACGELKAIIDNLTSINNAIVMLGGTKIDTKVGTTTYSSIHIWSSTCYNNTSGSSAFWGYTLSSSGTSSSYSNYGGYNTSSKFRIIACTEF